MLLLFLSICSLDYGTALWACHGCDCSIMPAITALWAARPANDAELVLWEARAACSPCRTLWEPERGWEEQCRSQQCRDPFVGAAMVPAGFASASQLIPLESPGLSKGVGSCVFMLYLLICAAPAASAEICFLGVLKVGVFMDSLQIKIHLLVQSMLIWAGCCFLVKECTQLVPPICQPKQPSLLLEGRVFAFMWKLRVDPVSTRPILSLLLSIFTCALAYVQTVNLTMLKSQIKTGTFIVADQNYSCKVVEKYFCISGHWNHVAEIPYSK